MYIENCENRPGDALVAKNLVVHLFWPPYTGSHKTPTYVSPAYNKTKPPASNNIPKCLAAVAKSFVQHFHLTRNHGLFRTHRRRSLVNFRGARHFCPKIYAWKIIKMPAFYMIFARKKIVFARIWGGGATALPDLPSPTPMFEHTHDSAEIFCMICAKCSAARTFSFIFLQTWFTCKTRKPCYRKETARCSSWPWSADYLGFAELRTADLS